MFADVSVDCEEEEEDVEVECDLFFDEEVEESSEAEAGED